MTDRDTLLGALQAVVTGVVGPARTPEGEINAATRLTEGGFWLDSVEMLEVIVACEAEFTITFEPASDLSDDHLQTLGTLADLIRAKNPQLSRA